MSGLFSKPSLGLDPSLKMKIDDTVCSLSRKLELVNTEPRRWWGGAHKAPESTKPRSGMAAPACNLRDVFTRERCWRVSRGVWSRLAMLLRHPRPPWQAGWTPQPLLLQFHRLQWTIQMPRQWRTSGAHSPRVTYSPFEATVELLWVLQNQLLALSSL